MQDFKLKRLMILVGILFLQTMAGSFALAKKKHPPKAFSFIAEGGKASQGECDGEGKIPRKLKHLKEFAKEASYMGSELEDPEINVKAGQEMWKHFFRAKISCNAVLAKTPSSVDKSTKTNKTELPPDDSADSDDDADKSDGSDSE